MIPEAEILRLRNLLIYALVAALNGAATVFATLIASGAFPLFEEGGWAAPAKGIALATLAVLVPALTSWLASNRPRLGSEQIAAQVDVLRERGGHRTSMRVLQPAAGPPDERRPINHEQCGHDGLLTWVAPVREKDMLDALHVRHLDGRRFADDAEPTCDNCGAVISFVYARDGAWIARSNPPRGQ